MIDAINALMNIDPEDPVSSKEVGEPSQGVPSQKEANRDVSKFSLASPSAQKPVEGVAVEKTDLMTLIREKNSDLIDKEIEEALRSAELEEQIENLKSRLNDFRLQMHDSERTERMEEEHIQAVNKIMDLIDKDLEAIAKHTGQQSLEDSEEKDKEPSVARRVLNWIASGEEVLNRALLYFSDRKGRSESIGEFLKIQYAVQRATQRAELFSSIVGTTVSSVKTIMTTQLG